MKVTNKILLLMYEKWSEEVYCAGFLTPDPHSVKQFREWLRNEMLKETTLEDYEQQFLDEYCAQEAGI